MPSKQLAAAKKVLPKGYVIVPVEPTPEMRIAFQKAHEEYENPPLGVSIYGPDHQWAAMLAAAPNN
jgi:hypothetical protein